jgi:hypothetical protein
MILLHAASEAAQEWNYVDGKPFTLLSSPFSVRVQVQFAVRSSQFVFSFGVGSVFWAG